MASGMSALTKNQWRHIRHWIVLVALAEGLMCAVNRYLSLIYLVIAISFLAGFALRVFNLYPGKTEPLSLDSSAVAIALIFSYIAGCLEGSPLRFLLIFISSLIMLPHLIYIISKKDIY
jgi:hypothetical protein